VWSLKTIIFVSFVSFVVNKPFALKWGGHPR